MASAITALAALLRRRQVILTHEDGPAPLVGLLAEPGGPVLQGGQARQEPDGRVARGFQHGGVTWQGSRASIRLSHSRRALEWAVTEAAAWHVPLRVLSVYQTTAASWGGALAPEGDGALAQDVRKTALEETEQVLDALDEESRPPSVTVLAVSGVPAEELLRAADGAEMIVVGSRGAGGFRQLLVGSVASQVVHHANCPVVTVPTNKC